MKCDELKPYLVGYERQYYVYDATSVEEAIAELKKKLMPCLNGDCILTCEVVEKYGKENAELKQKLEDVQASHYAESVDAGMRERRLRRALWLARAKRANEHYHRYHGKFLCPLEDIPEYVKWKQVERKCRAKAEEYK